MATVLSIRHLLFRTGAVLVNVITLPLSALAWMLAWSYRKLPERWAYWLSSFATSIMFSPMFWVRRANFRKFFTPLGWTRGEIRALHRRHRKFLAQWMADVARLLDATSESLAGKLIVEGEEHLQSGLAKGKGVLLLNVHLGNWWYGRACLWLRGYRLVGVSNRVEILAVERFLVMLRKKFLMRSLGVATGGSKAAENVFAGNGIFSVHFDVAMPLRWDHSRWFPLGAAMIHADVGPARLALRHEAAVLLLTSVRTEEGGYRVTITPMPVPDGIGPEELHARWLGELDRLLLRHPEQWWNWGAVWLRGGR